MAPATERAGTTHGSPKPPRHLSTLPLDRGAFFRWFRFAQPPANICDPSGVGSKRASAVNVPLVALCRQSVVASLQ